MESGSRCESCPARQLQAWIFGLSLGAVFAVVLDSQCRIVRRRELVPIGGVEFGTIDAGLSFCLRPPTPPMSGDQQADQ